MNLWCSAPPRSLLCKWEVTKEAAELILVDDNFASITTAMREGRTIYNNIEKAIPFMLPTNVAQALVIAVRSLLGLPCLFGICRFTLVGLALLISTLVVFSAMKASGVTDALARTATVNPVTIGQAFYLLNSRHPLESSFAMMPHLGNVWQLIGGRRDVVKLVGPPRIGVPRKSRALSD